MSYLLETIGMDFLLTAVVVVLVPGTGVIYTLSNGLFRGSRASVAAAFGCTMGIVPHLLASVLGLAAVLHTSALAYQILKVAGVAYLLYMAWNMWRETGSLSLGAPETLETNGGSDASDNRRLGAVAIRGTLINILNPKLSVFFLAFLPQFIPASAADELIRMGVLSAVFMALTFAIFVAYGMAATLVRDYVLDSARVTRWTQRVFAGAFAAFAAKLAVTDR
ncbi:LysE family translocator [Arhodomonas sp. AD133]|uniref:LysE family translocator n=1 Tax=Arhodomonas sp. AD133 TaxID=3415009 RepID=UPI003EBCDC52